MTSSIGVGDLLRAWCAVGGTPETVPTLLRVLGIELVLAEPGEKSTLQPGPAERRPGAAVSAASHSISTPPEEVAGEPAGPTQGQAVTLRRLPPRALTTPTWARDAVLPRPKAHVLPSPASLFEPLRERAILAASARSHRAEGPIDIAAVVEAMTRCRPLAVLPRLRIPSLRGGVQLVIDRSPWMAPFAADVDALRRRLIGVIGAAVEEIRVRAADGAGFELRPAWTPRRGVPVVIVGDLGRAALRSGREAPGVFWADLAHRASAADAEVVAVVPGRRASYDSVIPPGINVVSWDRSTRVVDAAAGRRARR